MDDPMEGKSKLPKVAKVGETTQILWAIIHVYHMSPPYNSRSVTFHNMKSYFKTEVLYNYIHNNINEFVLFKLNALCYTILNKTVK